MNSHRFFLCLGIISLISFGSSKALTEESTELTYQDRCAVCHGTVTQPGFAPSLYNTPLNSAEFVAVVRSGRGPMPAFNEQDLDSTTLANLFDYLNDWSSAQTETSSDSNPPPASTGNSNTGNSGNQTGSSQLGGNVLPGNLSTGNGNLYSGLIDSQSLSRVDLSQLQYSPEQVYRSACQACHQDLRAPLTESSLSQQSLVPDLRFSRLKFEAFKQLVGNGHKAMPAFPQIASHVHFKNFYQWLKAFSLLQEPSPLCRSQAIQTSHHQWGQPLYKMYCARCHGEKGTGTSGSSGRLTVAALDKKVAVGQIRYLIEKGHSNAPAFNFLATSDRFQLANYVAEMMNWESFERAPTPTLFKMWNGGRCQQDMCADFALAADQKVLQRQPTDLPIAASLECKAYQKKNRKKGPAGPGSIYPDCWAQQEVDLFQSFCGDYRPGISETFAQNRQQQVKITAQLAANSQLKSPWSEKQAVLTCQLDSGAVSNVTSPPDKPNWQVRLYLELVESSAAKENTCWWADPKNQLGEGNPKQSSRYYNQITLFVRLPEGGRIPKAKWRNSHRGVEDQDVDPSQLSKKERPFYSVINAVQQQPKQSTIVSLSVARNLQHDQTRNPNRCGACGNSIFTNEPWTTDIQEQLE